MFDSLNKSLLKLRLLTLEWLSCSFSNLKEFSPLFLQCILGVSLIFIHRLGLMSFGKVVHFSDRFELKVNVTVIYPDFLQYTHNASESVNVLCNFLKFEFKLFDFVCQIVKRRLSLLVQLLWECIFPLFNLWDQTMFKVISC